MTLYEALSRKRILEDKVSKITTHRYVDIKKKHADESWGGVDIVDIDKSIHSAYSSEISLIRNLASLKAAINEANVNIKVEIAGKRYSIADAISRQRSLDEEEHMYIRMANNLEAVEREIESIRERYMNPEAISNYVSKVLGDSKKDDALIQTVTEDYMKKYEPELYDPLNTKEIAKERLNEIALFREQIHYALTQANCSNSITVEFED